MHLTIDLDNPEERARAARLLALDEPVHVGDEPNIADDDAEHPEIPSDVLAYVRRHARIPRRQATMLDILAHEVRERDAVLLTGGEHNRAVRCCLPGTSAAYAVVTPAAGAVRLGEEYAENNPLVRIQKHTYKLLISFDERSEVEEFHRLAAIAFEQRKHA